MWEVHNTAKAYGRLPSQILGVTELFAAFCVDRAVYEFGAAIEAAIDGVEAKTDREMSIKVDRVLRKWLDLPAQYRDPAKSGHVQLPSKREE